MVLLGATHGLIFLPVLLSYIGKTWQFALTELKQRAGYLWTLSPLNEKGCTCLCRSQSDSWKAGADWWQCYHRLVELKPPLPALCGCMVPFFTEVVAEAHVAQQTAAWCTSLDLGTGWWVAAASLLWDSIPAFAEAISLCSDGPNTWIWRIMPVVYLKVDFIWAFMGVKTDGDSPAAADIYGQLGRSKFLKSRQCEAGPRQLRSCMFLDDWSAEVLTLCFVHAGPSINKAKIHAAQERTRGTEREKLLYF